MKKNVFWMFAAILTCGMTMPENAFLKVAAVAGGQILDDKLGVNSKKLFIQHPTGTRSTAGLHNDDIDQWNTSERAELFNWLIQLGFLANE